MKFAVVNGARQEAEPGLTGTCAACAGPMVAKCGEIKAWHWAHQAGRACDPWWENESAWHRAWKNEFPRAWQEVIQTDANGERHIADVKTDYGWVIELQHSYLEPEERRSRNGFYPKLAWVVDGTRRKTDRQRFLEAWNGGLLLRSSSPVRRVRHDACPLLREWADTIAPVFLDFGHDAPLWWLLAKGSGGYAYLAPFSRADFVAIHCDGATKMAGDFESFVDGLGQLVAEYEIQLRAQALGRPTLQATHRFQQPLSRTRSRRRL